MRDRQKISNAFKLRKKVQNKLKMQWLKKEKQTIVHKTQNLAMNMNPSKIWGDLRCSGRLSRSYSTWWHPSCCYI